MSIIQKFSILNADFSSAVGFFLFRACGQGHLGECNMHSSRCIFVFQNAMLRNNILSLFLSFFVTRIMADVVTGRTVYTWDHTSTSVSVEGTTSAMDSHALEI